MKKIISLSLLALVLGANIPTNVKAEDEQPKQEQKSILSKIDNFAYDFTSYPVKKLYSSAKYGIHAGIEFTKATVSLVTIILALETIANGVRYALLCATNETGCPEIVIRAYKGC